MKGLSEEEIEAACEAGFAELWKSDSLRKLTTERLTREVYRLGFYDGGRAASVRAADILDECLAMLRAKHQSLDSFPTPLRRDLRTGFEMGLSAIEDAFGVPHKKRIVPCPTPSFAAS